MVIYACDLSYLKAEIEGITVRGQLRQNVSVTLSQQVMVGHTYNSSYLRGIGRRIVV
jgi:hypothetical protein